MSGLPRPGLLRRRLPLPRPAWPTLWATLALGAAVLFLYREALLSGRVIYRRDASTVWLPQVESLVRVVLRGSWPLWDPYPGLGRPLLADPRAEVLYPPTWLNLVLSPRAYYAFFVALHALFSGLGLWHLLRRYGASGLAALTGAGVWVASGPFFSLTLMWHHMAGAAWIPWLFLALERLCDLGRERDAWLAGLTLALQIVAGSPDLTALVLPALGAYTLVRRPAWRRAPAEGRLGRVRGGLQALAFGLALTAPLWLATFEWWRASERTKITLEQATSWSQHPWLLAELGLPLRVDLWPLQPAVSATLLDGKEPWLHSIYLGLPALSLALGALAGRAPRRWYFAALAGISLLLALGRHAPFYGWALTLVPALRTLRFPVKALVLAAFALAVLAGLGLDAWRRAAGHRGRWVRLVPAALLTLVAAATLGATNWWAESLAPAFLLRGDAPSFRHLLAGTSVKLAGSSVLGLVLLALGAARRPGPRLWSAVLLAALALGAPLAQHRQMGWTAPAELWTSTSEIARRLDPRRLPRVFVYDYTRLNEEQLKSNPQAPQAYRVARGPAGWSTLENLVLGVQHYMHPPTAARWGIFGSFDRDILGFDPLPLARLNEFLRRSEARPAHLNALRMAAVDYAVGLAPGDWWRPLEEWRQFEDVFVLPTRVFRVPRTQPRAYLVGRVRVVDGDAAHAALDDPAFDPAAEALVAHQVAELARADPAGEVGQARLLSWRPDRVRLATTAPGPRLLVLADAYDPGWRAWLDGREVPVLRANIALRGVVLPPGHHQVEFAYRPRAVGLGLAVAGVALALAACRLWRERPRAGRETQLAPGER